MTFLGASFGTYRRRRGYVPLRQTSWWRTTKTSLGVSFETCLRRCCYVLLRRRHDVPIRCRGAAPLRVLTAFHRDVVGCFIWDVLATSLGSTERRRYDVATTFCCRLGYFFDAISMVEKFASFPRMFFDVISMGEKSTLFPRSFFDVISMAKTSTLLFPRIFRYIFDVRNIHVICTYFFRRNFDG